jgi:1L-myo-inositol 1-phosphate cytidylyltransferase
VRAVLLAAGLGSRLGNLVTGAPKPLIAVAGRPLVSYTLDSLKDAGVEEVVVVTGYRETQLRDALRALSPLSLRFETNPEFRSGAARSLAAARQACGQEPFLLVMSDHLLEHDLVARLAGTDPADGAAVAADATPRSREYTEEATRLLVDDGFVRDIGKMIPEFTHLDAGAFHCSEAAWDALDTVPMDSGLSEVFTVLAQAGRMRAADVTGAFWYDVDTPEDRREAERLLRRREAVA